MLSYTRLHWFPFCPSDWIAKCSNAGLSVPGQGVLLRLMCAQWLDGSIPSDQTSILKILNGYDGPGLPEALALFVPLPNDATRLRYLPLEASRQEAIIAHKKRASAGRKGAAKTNAQKSPVFAPFERSSN